MPFHFPGARHQQQQPPQQPPPPPPPSQQQQQQHSHSHSRQASHHHQHTPSDPATAAGSSHIINHHHSNYPAPPTATNSFFQAGQTLASIGAPSALVQSSQQLPPPAAQHPPQHHQTPSAGPSSTTAPDTRGYQPLPPNGNSTVIPYRPGPSAYSNSSALPPEPQTPQSPPYSSAGAGVRRSLTIASTRSHQTDDLHLHHGQPSAPPAPSAMSDIHHYGAPPAYGGAGEGLSIKIDPSTPQQQQQQQQQHQQQHQQQQQQQQQQPPPHPNSASAGGNPIPGTLQPGFGLPTRPPPLGASNNAPSMPTLPTLPTLPQISTQMQQPPLSARPNMSSSHSYSRSSPGTMEQPKYKPYGTTPEQGKYVSPAGSGYMPQTPLGPSSYSPLGLADIRGRTDMAYPDPAFNASVAQEQESDYPKNSTYTAPWPIYAVDWCKWPPRSNPNNAGKIAIGSYLEDNHNYIQILDAQRTQIDPENPHGERGLEFVKTAEATHAYPVTRILWEPPSSNKQATDLLATSGDHLRLWSLPSDSQAYPSNSITRNNKTPPLQKLSPLALLSNSKSPEHTAPITSLDWNVMQPSLIITSSIDTTCTIWDIPTLTAKTQLIAHDKEVYDVRFCANSVDVFVSCGADGSVRMFDLRSLEHSTIIYEPSDKQADKNSLPADLSSSPTRPSTTLPFPPPLLRIAASPHDAHLLATFSSDSSVIRVLDVRQPGQALLELRGHGAPVNCIDWSNAQRGVLASGADDSCVLLWDLMGSSASTGLGAQVPGGGAAGGGSGQERGPSAVWQCEFEVGNLSWAPTAGTLGVCGGRSFWGVQL